MITAIKLSWQGFTSTPLSSLPAMSPSSLIGKVAPAFTLKNHDGTDYEFKPESGTPTAIFFYPKSGTQPERLTPFKELTTIQGLMGAPGRHANLEMHSSVGDHPLSSSKPGNSLPDFYRKRCIQGVKSSSDRHQPGFSRGARHVCQEAKVDGEIVQRAIICCLLRLGTIHSTRC